MEAMQDYWSKTSLLGAFAPVLLLLLATNVLLTLVHSNQERKGRLWRYFGAIAGVRIPDSVGFLLFFIGLTIILWIVGFVGMTGHLPIGRVIPDEVAIAAIGILIGGRLSDRLYSHIRLDRQGYRPNPGLTSTRYYLLEAVLILILFVPGLLHHYVAAGLGFVIGWGFFYSVIPILRSLRTFPSLRRQPWRSGEPIPSWAQA